MNNINDCYEYVNSILRKQYSGSMSGDTFNQWATTAQILHLLVKCGLPEAYKIGPSGPGQGQRKAIAIIREAPQELEATMTLSDEMIPFLVTTPVSGTNNRFTLPTDFVRYRAGTNYTYIYQKIDPATGQPYTDWRYVPFEFVTGAERSYRLYQYTNPPSAEYPIISYDNGQIKVDADVKGQVLINNINLNYVRLPKDPKRAYRPNINDQPIYDPNNSVDFEFPKTEWEALCRRVIRYWAESIRDNEISQENFQAVIIGE